MFVKKSTAAVSGFVKRLMDDILNLNWNDHMLAEMGTSQPTHSHSKAENDEM